jgi:hypothetical protein
MKKILVYPDVPHFRSVAHLKLGKILSLAIFLMVLFASGQQAKSEDGIIWTKDFFPYKLLNAVFSPDDQFIYATCTDAYYVFKYDLQGNKIDSIMNVGGIKQFSKDGKYFWNFYGDKYDATTFEKIYSFAGGIVDNINDWNLEINEAANLGIACSYGKKIRTYYSVQYDSSLIIVDLTDGHIISYTAYPGDNAYGFSQESISPDGSKVAFLTGRTVTDKQEEYTAEMHIEIWKLPEFVKDKQIILDLSGDKQSSDLRLKFSPDGSVLGYQHDGGVTLYSTTDYSVVWESESGDIYNFNWDNNNKYFYLSTGFSGMYKIEYETKNKIFTYPKNIVIATKYINFNKNNNHILCGNSTLLVLLDNTITSVSDPFFIEEYETTLLQNQTNNNYQLQIVAIQPNIVNYFISDAIGNILIPNLTQNLMQGINVFDIETSALPSGTYFINIEISGHSQTLKFIVVR